jgi:outer membrane lipoprotein-sorting protein
MFANRVRNLHRIRRMEADTESGIGTRLASMTLLCCALGGCVAISRKHAVPPAEIRTARTANEPELLAAYNKQATYVRTINATVTLSPVAGSAYTGVIEEYHDVGGFILAARPAMIRVIGQAPVVSKDVFDMVSDGQTFRIFIPSKNSFLIGSTALERPSKNPIENLRPQHILDALFWVPMAPDAPVLFEEFDASPARFYVLTLLRNSEAGLEISRKIWFDRLDLRITRIQIYGSGGRLDSDISYSDWQRAMDVPPSGVSASAASEAYFPWDIRISRPQQDYQLNLSITKLTLNAEIPPDRFNLVQPPGTELTRVGQDPAQSLPPNHVPTQPEDRN